MTLRLALLLLSFFCFMVSAWPGAAALWNRLISSGLALWVASMLVGG